MSECYLSSETAMHEFYHEASEAQQQIHIHGKNHR